MWVCNINVNRQTYTQTYYITSTKYCQFLFIKLNFFVLNTVCLCVCVCLVATQFFFRRVNDYFGRMCLFSHEISTREAKRKKTTNQVQTEFKMWKKEKQQQEEEDISTSKRLNLKPAKQLLFVWLICNFFFVFIFIFL